jgi:large subunit ribosomal protein L25
MPERFTLAVQSRQVMGKHVRRLRADGITPANISGGERPSVAVQIPGEEMARLLKRHSASMLYLQIGGSKTQETAILGRIERDPVTTHILHVDFRRVKLNQPIHARVPVHLTGESPAVKIEGGVLLHLLDTVEIESLPANIPESVTLDISSLTELNSLLTVADVKLPTNVTLVSPETEPVVTIKPPRIEVPEVEAPAAAEGEAAAKESEAGTAEESSGEGSSGEA